MNTRVSLIFTLIAVLILAACGPADVPTTPTSPPTNTPLPTPTPTPTATSTPTPTATFTPTTTPTPTRTPPPACRFVYIKPVTGVKDPVTGAAIPAYEYQAEGFPANDSVGISISGKSDLGGMDVSYTCGDDVKTNAQGQVEGSVVWCGFGGKHPTEMVLEISRGIWTQAATVCTVSQTVTWP